MKQQDIVPVYMLTGFIESGKTSMIRTMLTDEGFSVGQKTLVILCEEGEEELEDSVLKKGNAVVESLDGAEELSALRLKELNNRHKPERVIIEYNNMWGMERIYSLNMPPYWQFVQVISLADATTFASYMTNMRKVLTDPMKDADLILVNRCGPDFNKSSWRKQLRAMNPGANILFENPDGSTEDGVSDEDLPYDMKAEVIDISEENYGIFYLDAMDHPERYDQRKIRVTGHPYPDRTFPAGFYYLGREAMTCCANDIQRCGWVCQGLTQPDEKSWLSVTASCEVVTSPEGQQALLLHEMKAEKTRAPKEKYVTFGTV